MRSKSFTLTIFKSSPKNWRGFTLIELLVSIAIMVMIIAFALPQIKNFRERANLNQTAEDIRRTIIDARTMAMAPKEDQPSKKTAYSAYVGKDKRELWNFALMGEVQCIPPFTNCQPIESHDYPSGITVSAEESYCSGQKGQQLKGINMAGHCEYDAWFSFEIGNGTFWYRDYPATSNITITVRSANHFKNIYVNNTLGTAWISPFDST